MGLMQWFILLLIPTMGYSFLNPFSAFRLGRQNCGYVMPLCSSQTQRPYPYYSSSLENIENYGYYGYGYQPHSRPWAFVNHVGHNRGTSEPSAYSSNSAYSYNPSYSGAYTGYNHHSNPNTAYGYSRNWQASNTKPIVSTVERQKTSSYNKPSSYKA